MIPHHQWVHFAVGCRKLKASDDGEVRIFINGSRVGFMRINFPVATPPSAPAAPPQLLARPTIPPDAIRISFGRAFRGVPDERKPKQRTDSTGREEDNEWMLGRTLLLEEAVLEDVVLLMHHLVSFPECIWPQILTMF